MDQIAEVARELKYPGARALWSELRRRGVQVERKAVESFLKGRAERQLRQGARFNRKLRGSVAATGLRRKWYLDLLDLKQDPSGQWEYIMYAIDVYSKYIWVRPTKTKLPTEMVDVFRSIVEDAGERPDAVYTDDGGEWTGPFDWLMSNLGITRIHKESKADLNFMGVLDASAKQFRRMLEEEMDREGSEWEPLLQGVAAAMNRIPRPALFNHPAAAVEAKQDPSLEFSLQAQAAHTIAQTGERVQRRAQILEGGTFRTPVHLDFRQGYRPRWSGEVHRVEKVEGSRVYDTKGRSYDTRLVQPVEGGADVEIRPRQKAATTRAELGRWGPVRPAISDFVARQPEHKATLARVGQFIRQELRMEVGNKDGALRKLLETLGFEVYKTGTSTFWVRASDEDVQAYEDRLAE